MFFFQHVLSLLYIFEHMDAINADFCIICVCVRESGVGASTAIPFLYLVQDQSLACGGIYCSVHQFAQTILQYIMQVIFNITFFFIHHFLVYNFDPPFFFLWDTRD